MTSAGGRYNNKERKPSRLKFNWRKLYKRDIKQQNIIEAWLVTRASGET